MAAAFKPWVSDELIPGLRCAAPRKESLFLCVQQMLRKKFDLYKMPIDKEGGVMFTAFCGLLMYSQEHFDTTAEELAGIILTHQKRQFNVFVLKDWMYCRS